MLNIYRASAGSGKTYRLTAKYLELLFAAQRQAHRNILAVTFTNKATDEMKSRILLELDALSATDTRGEKSAHLENLAAKFHLSEKDVRQRAKDILTGILHDYSRFSVSTIDKFFQQIVRAFAREIGLQGGYNVELDQEGTLSLAIDRMMFDLDKKENQELLNWLTKFSEERIENGEKWDIRSNIKNFASKLIFNEKYKNLGNHISEKLQNKDFLKKYQAELYAIKKNFESEIKNLAEKSLAIIEKHGLATTDFKNAKNSPFNRLHKLRNGEFELTKTFLELPDNVENWFTKKSPNEAEIKNAFYGGLNDCINEIVVFYDKNFSAYLSADVIGKNFYTLGILADIDKQVKTYLEENNLMLLSDGNSLLNKIIDDSDTPFVYEKTGVNIDHYMIDEFQDTSSMQWDNFRPLVKNSLSQGLENLIVGDVKQSIYRWRNSDWDLLDSQITKDFPQGQINEETLGENWRSRKNIIEFNNVFFETAAGKLQAELGNEKIGNAYKNLRQDFSPKSKNGGRISVEFIKKEKNADWKDEVLQKIPPILDELQKNNYQLKDIAILVRDNKDARKIANYLLEYKNQNPHSTYKYDVISNEALQISNAESIRFIVALLKFLQNKEDKISERIISLSPPKSPLKGGLCDSTDFFQSCCRTPLPCGEGSWEGLGLFELIEDIISRFDLGKNENESVFLQAFQDLVFDFVSRNNADISAFLKWWDEFGIKKSIASPEGQNAIQIMTIHKSKGLEREAVIVPFANWEFDHDPKKKVVFWCEPKVAPYNQLEIIPIPYSAKLENTIFRDDYLEEKTYSYIDNLNIAYVAFTRAKSELFIFAQEPEKDEIKTIGDLLFAVLKEKPGILYQDETKKSEKEETKIEEIKLRNYISSSDNNRLRLRLHSTDYFGERGEKINYGNIMHELLNKIRTIADLENAVTETLQSGKINFSESLEIKEKLRKFIELQDVKDWFSDKYKILNETDIITPQGEIYRPDRVLLDGQNAIVIDYKFGEKEEQKYNKQVLNYVELIENMGFSAEGFVCYVELGKIVSVNM